jgi:hypothetical protein
MLSIHNAWVGVWAKASLYLVVIFSMWSAIAYFVKFWGKVDVSTKQRRRQELLDADRVRRGVVRSELREDWQKRRVQARTDRMSRRRARAESRLSREAPDLPPSA